MSIIFDRSFYSVTLSANFNQIFTWINFGTSLYWLFQTFLAGLISRHVLVTFDWPFSSFLPFFIGHFWPFWYRFDFFNWWFQKLNFWWFEMKYFTRIFLSCHLLNFRIYLKLSNPHPNVHLISNFCEFRGNFMNFKKMTIFWWFEWVIPCRSKYCYSTQTPSEWFKRQSEY